MPLGHTNAPTIFMHLINDILHLHLGPCVIIYINDIVIFSKRWDDHLQHVHTILDILCTHKLRVKRQKYSFGKIYIHYLGFLITQFGILANLHNMMTLLY